MELVTKHVIIIILLYKQYCGKLAAASKIIVISEAKAKFISVYIRAC